MRILVGAFSTAIALVVMAGGHALANPLGPAPSIVGLWESEAPNNAYQLRVTWNEAAGRYEGVIVRLGAASTDVGFPLGELIWIATPSTSPATLAVQEEWRRGRRGQTMQVWWREGLLYLDKSSPTRLLTSITVYRKVAKPTEGTAAPGALPASNEAALPSAAEVTQKISGRDPVDTAAKQLAALKAFEKILTALPERDQETRRAHAPLMRDYMETIGKLRRQFGPPVEALSERYLSDQAFTRELTHVSFPGVGRYLDDREKAASEARAAAQAKAAKMAEEKARAEAERVAAAAAAIQERKKAKAARDADAKRLAMEDAARASGVADTTVFQVRLGVPAPLPDCDALAHQESDTAPGRNAALTGSDLTKPSSKSCLVLEEDGTTSIHWGDNVLPPWAELVETQFKADVLVSVQITIPSQARPPTSEEIGFGFLGGLMASMSNEAKRAAYERMLKEGPENVAKAQKDLLRKYKAPHQPVQSTTYTRNGAFLRKVQEPEWIFPGLHVKYDADTFEDTILIELESVTRARAEAKRKKEAAEGKL